MTPLCPVCWRPSPSGQKRCSHCGADLLQQPQHEVRQTLLAALSHSDRDTVSRAALALAAAGDPAAPRAIETAMTRFSDEPHVLAGLLGALTFTAGEDARRIAEDALAHRSFIVRRAAAQALRQIGASRADAGEGRSPSCSVSISCQGMNASAGRG